MSTYYWGFWYALMFLTRIPAPYLKRHDTEVQQAALWFYPVVGALLGAAMVTLVWLCFQYNPQVSVLLLAALVLTLWVYITGAMHLDGVADTADAWVGGLGSHERTLEIMKDPRVGSMGAAAMFVVLLLKFAAIAALLEQVHANKWLVYGGLLLIPILSRAGIIGLMATTPYVRKEGMVSNTKNAATKTKVTVLCVILVVLAFSILQHKALLVLLVWLLVLVGYRAVLNKRLGGYTGDTLGAGVEFQEVLLLVALAL